FPEEPDAVPLRGPTHLQPKLAQRPPSCHQIGSRGGVAPLPERSGTSIAFIGFPFFRRTNNESKNGSIDCRLLWTGLPGWLLFSSRNDDARRRNHRYQRHTGGG